MKSMKKILSLVMVLAMVLAMGVGALATDPLTDGTITVKNTPAETGISIKDQYFYAYQLFTVTYADSDNDGTNDRYSYLMNPDFASFLTSNNYTVADLSLLTSNSKGINDFTDAVRTYILDLIKAGTSIAPADTAVGGAINAQGIQTAEFTGLQEGYYIVLGGGSAEDGGDYVTSLCMLKTTDPDMVVYIKASAPKLDKEVREYGETDYGKVTDAQIGETVEYRLTSNVPDTNGYIDYTFIITDTLSSGLTFKDDIVVAIGGVSLTLDDDYTVQHDVVYPNTGTDNVTFKITINYETLLAAQSTADKTITVTYSAIVNSNAEIFNKDNPNTATLEYSNNPYTTETNKIDDQAKVYSYDLKLYKYEEEVAGNPLALAGAKFALYDSDPSVEPTSTPIALAETLGDTNVYRIDDGAGIDTKTVIVSPSSGKFIIEGLDSGTIYYLVETEAPVGFNPLDKPIVFTINTKEATGGLTIEAVEYDWNLDGVDSGSNIDINNELKILNSSGPILPSTGGIGTTIFYVVGIALVLLAVVLLVVKKRKNEVYED